MIKTEIADKRTAILDAAMRLIASQGFHAAPMSLIAKEAGVAAGTIYHYFKDKNDMIEQLYIRSKERMGEALLLNDDPNLSYKQRFVRFWTNLLHFYINNPLEFRFRQQYASSPFISSETKAENESHYAPVVAFLADGMAKEILREMDLRLLVTLVYGSVISVVDMHFQESLPIEGRILQDALQAAWDSVRIN